MSFSSLYKSGSTKNKGLQLKKSLFIKQGGEGGEGDEDEDDEEEEDNDDDEEEEEEEEEEDVKRVSKIKIIDDDDDEISVNSEEDDNSEMDEDNNSDGDEDDNDSMDSHIIGGVDKILGGNLSDEDDDEDEEDDDYLKKFDESLKNNVISEFHPEMLVNNYDEIDVLARVVRNEEGNIIDPLHKSLPFITKYEKARILGERAKQIDAGAKPFVDVDVDVIEGYLIALKEFEAKKIPFILKRPLFNGRIEYWHLYDLEILH